MIFVDSSLTKFEQYRFKERVRKYWNQSEFFFSKWSRINSPINNNLVFAFRWRNFDRKSLMLIRVFTLSLHVDNKYAEVTLLSIRNLCSPMFQLQTGSACAALFLSKRNPIHHNAFRCRLASPPFLAMMRRRSSTASSTTKSDTPDSSRSSPSASWGGWVGLSATACLLASSQ